MQHIEQAGVHSGDSACSLPPYRLGSRIQDDIRRQVKAMAMELGVVGLMNVQMAVQQDRRLRARSESTRVAHGAVRVEVHRRFAGEDRGALHGGHVARGAGLHDARSSRTTSASKNRCSRSTSFPGADPILGPEMKSTGEVMGVGDSFAEAFAKATLAAGERLPRGGRAFLSVKSSDKPGVAAVGARSGRSRFRTGRDARYGARAHRSRACRSKS